MAVLLPGGIIGAFGGVNHGADHRPQLQPAGHIGTQNRRQPTRRPGLRAQRGGNQGETKKGQYAFHITDFRGPDLNLS